MKIPADKMNTGVNCMIDMKIIGENIRRQRKQQLLTIEQLAERAGITDNFLGKIERGEGMPSLPTLDSIACALHVTMDSLKGDGQSTPEYRFIQSMMELNQLSPEKRERFIDFVSTNLQYFR